MKAGKQQSAVPLLGFSRKPYQAGAVVARKVLLTYLDQHPEGIL